MSASLVRRASEEPQLIEADLVGCLVEDALLVVGDVGRLSDELERESHLIDVRWASQGSHGQRWRE